MSTTLKIGSAPAISAFSAADQLVTAFSAFSEVHLIVVSGDGGELGFQLRRALEAGHCPAAADFVEYGITETVVDVCRADEEVGGLAQVHEGDQEARYALVMA